MTGIAAYSSGTTYYVPQQVTSSGNVYQCIAATTGNAPPNATYWTLIGPSTLDSITDGTTYKRVLATALTGNAIDLTKSGVLMKGSTPPVCATSFSFTSTATSITWSWASNTAVYRADGTVTVIGAGSQTITGLLASTLYNFYPIYDETLAELRFVTSTDIISPSLVGYTGNGTTGYVETTTSLSQPGNFSTEIWFNSTTAANQPLFDLSAPQLIGTETAKSFFVYVDNTGNIHAYVGLTAVTNGATSTIDILDGQTHHIVVTWNNSTFAGVIYVDGVSVATITGASAMKATTGLYWHIGGENANASWGLGANVFATAWLSNAVVYPVTLTAAQVLANYSCGNNLGQTALAAAVLSLSPSYYWKLGETTGTTAADSAGSNTGTYKATVTLGVSEATHSAVGSPAVAWVQNTYLAQQAQIVQTHVPLSVGPMQVTTPASGSGTPGTGGGVGGGGHGFY